jgi:benzoyl-CoA 2,3-dioxygenase component A
MNLIRQHLIDPEICIRCNTCEETCPINAITHDDSNYVVDESKCKSCSDCIGPCPTGAVDSWRMVLKPWSVDEQFSWEELPEEEALAANIASEDSATSEEALESEASEILEQAHLGQGGKAAPPYSAASPHINLYSRANAVTARVAGNFRITGENTESDIRHIVLDFGVTAFPVLEGQSIGIVPPGTDDKGQPHNIRLYSVASPRDGERPNHNNLSLTVKRVVYEENGKVKYGVGSNYVCNLEKGDEVFVTGPFGASFLMPNHPTANLILICTGTGSAPFRAMTERRRRTMPRGVGRLLLFFGARTPEELPYFGPLNKLPASLIDKELVFSRLKGVEKEYVQDRLLLRSADIAKLLQSEDTYIYICGLKGMEKGVEASFEKIADLNGQHWPELMQAMRKSGRYHVETY